MSEPGTLATLGKIITSPQMRDAVHIAVAPVIAAERLMPGDHVALDSDGKAFVVDYEAEVNIALMKPVGIVDPFLKKKKAVRAGQTFWLYLYPNTITGLHHLWTHPAFPEVNVQADRIARSKAWIEALAEDCEKTYEEFMDAATLMAEHGDYTYDNSEDYKNSDVYALKIEEFWNHYELVTGTAPKNRDHFYTCSC